MTSLLILSSMIAAPLFAASGGDLDSDDFVGVSFWLVTAAMAAATVFFFAERSNVEGKWKTSLTVAGLICGIAFWHYLYMRGVWVDTGETPTVFRYIDWLLTVPLQMVEFYLILAAVTVVAGTLFWQLLFLLSSSFSISWRSPLKSFVITTRSARYVFRSSTFKSLP